MKIIFRLCSIFDTRKAGKVAMLAACLTFSFSIYAADLSVTGPLGEASVSITKAHPYGDIYLDKDRFNSQFILRPEATDVGKEAEIFLVARVNGRYFMKTPSGWQPWLSTRLADLQSLDSRVLTAEAILPTLENDALYAGEYALSVGYKVVGGELKFDEEALTFSVEESASDSLLRFSSPEKMEAYIKEGLATGVYQRNFYLPGTVFDAVTASTAEPGMVSDSSLSSALPRVSGTNLQEDGVDESDVVKTDGNTLFMLNSCDNAACVQVHALDAEQAQTQLQASIDLGTEVMPQGMYLIENTEAGADTLITLSGQNHYSWYDFWAWQQGKTELKFLDVSNPQQPQMLESLEIDGTLVASRRVGNTLYVVSRYTPLIEGFNRFPLEEKQAEENAELLETLTLPEILPRVVDSRDEVLELISTQNCYLPVNAVDASRNPSIITITSIPINEPDNFSSTCFLGASETLYMTSDSLYLATTSFDYQNEGADVLYYAPEHLTAIHKFALQDGGINYSGSGQVKGHLGWVDDKKSFRLGENGDYLNVVTSIGDPWGQTSSTRLTVLKTTGSELQVVSVTDGIGKPGEQLYAARFMGDRAYLVTFRITDPLYVLDLSDQEHPEITGELEIAGYSDYLHPISENLLLGIGKDAVADDNATDFEVSRGAWYQGVKVALFDVSDLANPVELDSLVLGKRGTESEVLWDHHAFSWLPAVGSEAVRFAIPVDMHERVPQWGKPDLESPSTRYDYSYSALFAFEASELGLAQAGLIISDTAKEMNSELPVDFDDVVLVDSSGDDADVEVLPVDSTSLFAPNYYFYGDRSVLIDDAVFYMHDGEVLTSFWGETKDLSGK